MAHENNRLKSNWLCVNCNGLTGYRNQRQKLLNNLIEELSFKHPVLIAAKPSKEPRAMIREKSMLRLITIKSVIKCPNKNKSTTIMAAVNCFCSYA